MNTRIHRDVPVGAVLLAFSAVALYFAAGIKGEAKIVPTALTALMMACALVILLNGIRAGRAGAFDYKMKLAEGRHAFVFMGFILAYFLAFRYISYWIATPVFLILAQRHLKVKSWKVILAITVVYTVFAYVMFVIVLKLPIYKIGILGKYFRYG